MEGIFYIWIGGTIRSLTDYTWDDDPNSPTYGEEFCFRNVFTEYYIEYINDSGDIVKDGNYQITDLADGRPYTHIAFSLEEVWNLIPATITEYL